MVAKLKQCFYKEASEPQLVKKSVEGKPYEEGKNLPNSIEEDVGAFSLRPTYHRKQIRRILRIKKRTQKNRKLENRQKINWMEVQY